MRKSRKNLEVKIAELEGTIISLRTKIEEIESNSKMNVERTTLETRKEMEVLKIRMDAAIENLKHMLEMYTSYFGENFKTIFGDRFIEQLKEQVIQEVLSEAKNIANNATEETLYNKLEKFLAVEIRRAVIENGGEKLDKNALEAMVNVMVRNIMPQLLIENPNKTKNETTNETKNETTNERKKENGVEIKPFDASKELTHYAFGKMLDCLRLGLVPMLVGPAGTGKSTAVEQAARYFGLKYYMANRVANAYELIGYKNAVGEYVPTQFYEAYKNGGLFLFDEIDGSDPEALVTINTAIAQGYMAFPCGIVPMHPDFKLVAAGNTYGTGPNAQYCGRNKLDSATLDRFVVISWDYDMEIERKVCKRPELLEFVWALRRICEINHINIIISTRGLIATDKLIESENFSLAENIRANLLEGVKLDTLNVIKGGLESLHVSRQYIDAIDEIIQFEKSNSNKKVM